MTPELREKRRAAGRLGGQATASKHGRDYMSAIGKKGFVATAMKLGDNGAAVSFLQKRCGMARLPRSMWSKDKIWNEGVG